MFRNTLAQALELVVSTVTSLLLAPIMLSQLGLARFGVWSVVGALALYATLLDAGIARSLSRFVALHAARGDHRRVQECMGLGLLAVTAVGVVLVPVSWFGAPLLEPSTRGLLTLQETRLVLLGVAAIFVGQAYAGVIVSLPHGLQRMMAPNLATIAGTIVNFAVSVAVLLATDSLVVYAWANAASGVVTIALVLAVARAIWGRAVARPPSLGVVREVLGYSVRVQTTWVADLVTMSAGRVLVGLLVSVEAAGAFALGSSIATAIRQVGIITVSALVPTATHEIVHGGHEAVRRLFRRYAPLSLGLSMPVFALGALSAPFIVMAWLGESPPDTVAVLVALCVGFAANVMTGVPTSLWLADGHPGQVSTNAIITAAVSLALSLALAPVLGLWGVLLATVAALVALGVVLIAKFMRFYAVTLGDLRRAFLRPILLAVGVAAPLAPLVVVAAEHARDRPAALALGAAVAAAYGLPYWLLAERLQLLPEQLTRAGLRRRVAAWR